MSDGIFDPEIHAADKQGNPSLNKDGTFRKKRRDAGAKPTATGRASSKSPDYKGTVKDLLEAGSLFVSVFDRVDGATVAAHSDALAEACHKTAVAEPRFAAAIEGAMTASPYAALAMALAGMGAQLAHNHGLIPAGFLGTTDRRVIEKQLGMAAKQAEAQRLADEEQDRADEAAERAYHEAPLTTDSMMAGAV